MSTGELPVKVPVMVPEDLAKSTTNGSAPSNSPSLRWLSSSAPLFKPQANDTKDVSCMIEVLQDRVLRADISLSDLEKCLTRQVQEFVAKQATLCESLLRGDAEVIQSIRDADTVNAVVAQQLEASQAMSRNLLQRITGILEAPVAARVSAVPTLAPR